MCLGRSIFAADLARTTTETAQCQPWNTDAWKRACADTEQHECKNHRGGDVCRRHNEYKLNTSRLFCSPNTEWEELSLKKTGRRITISLHQSHKKKQTAQGYFTVVFRATDSLHWVTANDLSWGALAVSLFSALHHIASKWRVIFLDFFLTLTWRWIQTALRPKPQN